MGLAAAELADRVVVTSDNPRSEKPSAIVDEVLAGIPQALRSKVEVHIERAPAIRHAIEKAAPGDVVVIAGKGHETEQVLAGEGGELVRNHFDDREVAARALAELGAAKRGASVKV
jgi:UDP-N-acetylmuramoyl-L-alanyl-D-glutamate--2,6-diaminopimelate ligase